MIVHVMYMREISQCMSWTQLQVQYIGSYPRRSSPFKLICVTKIHTTTHASNTALSRHALSHSVCSLVFVDFC